MDERVKKSYSLMDERVKKSYSLMDERVPGEDEPAGGEEAKPRHQGEENGQPKPVPREQRQGPAKNEN